MTPTHLPPAKTTTSGNGHLHTGDPRLEVDLAGWPKKRLSIFPLMLDFGLVLIGFGLIIVRPLMSESGGYGLTAIGIVLVIVAAIGWLREARADYKRLRD